MKPKLNPCKYCGGIGKLYDFEHDRGYYPSRKSIKFLNSGNGLKTCAQCSGCKRITEYSRIPIDVINFWNNGEMYNSEEWEEKIESEYKGKIYSESEISDFIRKTKWGEIDEINLYFSNGGEASVIFGIETEDYYSHEFGILETDKEKMNNLVLDCLKNRKLKVKELERIHS